MRAAVPQLRFPGFAGEWPSRMLGDFIDEYREKSTMQDQHEVLTSARSGIIRQRDYFESDRLSDRDNVGFNIIPAGYITYRSRSDDRRFYFNKNDLGITGIISIFYPVFRLIECDPKFFTALLDRYVDVIGKYSVGTSQTVLSLNQLRKISLPISSIKEQTKIGSFLGTVDAKLDALRRKKSGLEAFKSGLMQRLFSQTLRFTRDDGTDFPDWEERTLGEIAIFHGGGTPDTNNLDFWSGETPWISSQDVMDEGLTAPKIGRWITEAAIKMSATQKVPAGTILVVTRVGVGKIAIANCALCTSQDFSNLQVKQGNEKFIAFGLLASRERLLALAQGTSIKGIAVTELRRFSIVWPHPDEQDKIANALSALDTKIAAVADQITHVESFKKGLLQQMFV